MDKRIEHDLHIAIAIGLAPKHHVINLWAVALEENIAGAQWNKDSGLIQRQYALSLYCKDSIFVASVGSLIQQSQIGDAVIGFVIISLTEYFPDSLIQGIKKIIALLGVGRGDEGYNLLLQFLFSVLSLEVAQRMP